MVLAIGRCFGPKPDDTVAVRPVMLRRWLYCIGATSLLQADQRLQHPRQPLALGIVEQLDALTSGEGVFHILWILGRHVQEGTADRGVPANCASPSSLGAGDCR